MANTKGLVPHGKLPVGIGSYGPNCTYVKDASGASLTADGALLVEVTSTGIHVALDRLTPLTVTPVNVFLTGERRVIKYWRTGEYVLKGAPKGAKAPRAAKVAAPKPVVTPVIAPVAPAPVAVVAPEPVPAPVPVAAAPVAVEPTAIVALEYPEHRAIKPMAKGYTRVGEVIALTRDVDTLTDALALRRAGMPAGVLITGPAGTAKTRLAEAFAGANGLPFLKISGGKIRSADDWFGGWGKDASGKLSWRPSPLTRVMDEGIECVVLVDEINRVESERALNGLFSVLDESGSTFIPDANRNVKMPKGILVIATANIGPEFVGTIPLDGALRDRLPWGVRMAYPVEAIEQKLLVDLTGISADTAGKLVRVANTQRAKRMDPLAFPSRSVISTRVLLDVARRVTQTGRDPREALWGALRGRFSPEDEPSLSVCVDAQFDSPPVEDEDINEVDLIGL